LFVQFKVNWRKKGLRETALPIQKGYMLPVFQLKKKKEEEVDDDGCLVMKMLLLKMTRTCLI